MLAHDSIHFARSLNLAAWAQHMTCVAGTTSMNPPLSFTEPLPVAKPVPDERSAASARTDITLTIEQRMRIDMFLATVQTWAVGATTEGTSWQVDSCFAARLHRNGDIDFIAPYLAGSHSLALITAHPVVTFLVSDRKAERWLEGRAQPAAVERSWEYAELLAYLQWRIPDAMDGVSGPIKVVVFRPIYLRYCDRMSDGSFEANW